MIFSGLVPDGFTTAALGNGAIGHADSAPAPCQPARCTVSETAPAAAGGTWKTTASVNGGPESP